MTIHQRDIVWVNFLLNDGTINHKKIFLTDRQLRLSAINVVRFEL